MFEGKVRKLKKDPYGFGNIWLNDTEAMIEVDKFLEMFGGDEAEFTHDYLYNHDSATRLWKRQFDRWKQDGILD